ncbi:MAG: CarD family transcriptional regulator [Pseudomonadota bacterium]|nr:CarD family transcriptional regulator [Pseudomonadota bacterium]
MSSKSAKVSAALKTAPDPKTKSTADLAPADLNPGSVAEMDAVEPEAELVDEPAAKAPARAPQSVEPPFRSPPKMPGHMPGMHGRPQIVPRAMAAKETFVEGDYVVYPTHGVGKVERIATEEIAGHKLDLIHITFEENRMTLRVPVSKARTAGLRKLATRKVFDEALALLKGRARIKRTMWSRRAQEYEQKINSGDPMQIAEVVRDLHRNAGQPDQSFSERQIYEAAMDRLAAELAALDLTDKPTAAAKLADYLKSIQRGANTEPETIEDDETVDATE